MSGKGDKQRRRHISIREYDLRWDLAFGRITPKQFARKYRDMRKQS